MRKLSFLTLGVAFTGLVMFGKLSAHSWSSEISYSTDNVTVTGSSRTWKEPGDLLASQQCIMWLWNGLFEKFYCHKYLLQVAYVSVSSTLQIWPQESNRKFAYDRDRTDANTSLAVSEPARGIWETIGQHFVEIDQYWLICPLGNCGFLVSRGRQVQQLETTRETEEVCGIAELDKLVREYDEYSISISPSCNAFANSGGSGHFSWSQLNGGFQNGNPHEPWGMVTHWLKNGVDHLASNHDNFSGIGLTSGYRCPHGNASIPGAAADSKHVHGRAADLRRGGWSEDEFNDLKQLANEYGATYTSEYSDYADHHLHVTF